MHHDSILWTGNTTLMTYLFGWSSVAEHQSPEEGHKSVTLMTILFVTSGKNGGFGVYVLSRVILKQRPQPGPYAVLLPYAA